MELVVAMHMLKSKVQADNHPVVRRNLDNIYRLMLTEHSPGLRRINTRALLKNITVDPEDEQAADAFQRLVDRRWFSHKNNSHTGHKVVVTSLILCLVAKLLHSRRKQ